MKSLEARLEVTSKSALDARSHARSSRGRTDVGSKVPCFEPGEIVGGKFRIGRQIGRGGTSVVYEAQHVQLGHLVAIKVLGKLHQPAKLGAFERALEEAQATARLTSDHIVRVFDVGTTKGGHAYVVMERLLGTDLASELKQGRTPPLAEAVQIVMQACLGLAEAHASGIVHRDIKPSNLFLALRSDDTVVVKVLDFGLAGAVARSSEPRRLSGPQRIAGSPGYAAPEQLGAASDLDERADIWGLGIVLYELVSGQRPFNGENLTESLVAAATLEVPAITTGDGSVPAAFESVVRRCLEKNREDRFPSVLELAEALSPFAPPIYEALPDRIRDVTRRGSHCADAFRMTLPDGDGSVVEVAADTAASKTEGGASIAEGIDEEAVAAAPLVVASWLPSPRAGGFPLVVGASLVLLLSVLFARGVSAPSRALAVAAPLPIAAALGPLGPLGPLVIPVAQASVSPPASRPREPATPAPRVVAPTPRTLAPRATSRSPAPAKPTPPDTVARVPAGDPMTYR